MELLSMLHAPGESVQSDHSYHQSRQMAQQLAGGRGVVLQGKGQGKQRPVNQEQESPHQQSSAASGMRRPPQQESQQRYDWRPDPRAKEENLWDDGRGKWQEQGYDAEEEIDKFTEQYSTPLDINRIPEAKRLEAERIANEIEAKQRRSGGNWVDSEDGRRSGGKSKGKGGGKAAGGSYGGGSYGGGSYGGGSYNSGGSYGGGKGGKSKGGSGGVAGAGFGGGKGKPSGPGGPQPPSGSRYGK